MQEEEEEGMKSRGGHETFVKRCRRREKIERSGGDTQQKQEVSEGGRKAWITHKYEKLKVHTWRCSCSMWNLNRSHIRTLNIASGFSLGLKVILHSAAINGTKQPAPTNYCNVARCLSYGPMRAQTELVSSIRKGYTRY